ncbi:MAG TPA: chromate resistance protein ChrB domain-containing protein [Blastocatellia bacterium]|nr:chromate resistance protein ChrB domain-containing protein [Blastocatellia bacterium]
MKSKTSKQEWILLIHQLPPQPTNLRVRIWRKLQRLGAVAIKNSVYVLPFNEKTHEDFQWLKQEIESSSGEATVFRAGAVEGATDTEIRAAIQKARDEEYAHITAELDGLTGAIREQKRGGHLSAGRVGAYEADLDRVRKELERVGSIDFFGAGGRSPATAAYERCHKALRASQNRHERLPKSSPAKGSAPDLAHYQRRLWVTRRNLFIDRLASIWLIKRFIDKRARFSFVAEGQSVEGGIGFDLYGGEFTHRGEDCTFETMINQLGLSGDAGLRQVAEIVHDMDLKDDKFHRSEAAGLNLVIRGLAELLKDDRKLVAQSMPIFDGLYELFGQNQEKSKRGENGKKRSQNRAAKRGRRAARK